MRALSNFVVRYNAFSNQLSILFNQQEQTGNQYSPFVQFRQQPFAKWAPLLKDACSKASGTSSFAVTFEGEELYAELLRLHLDGQPLHHAGSGSSLITTDHRLAWAQELSAESRQPFALPPFLFWPASQQNCQQTSLALTPAVSIPMLPAQSLASADVVFVQNEDEFPALALQQQTSNRMKLFLHITGTAWKLRQTMGSCCLAECPTAELNDRLRTWYLTFTVPGALLQFQQKLSGVSFQQSASRHLLLEKRRMLTDDRPYLELNLPTRIEIGDNSTRFDLVKLPEDLATRTILDGGVVTYQKPFIIPQKEGTCDVTVTVPDHPEYTLKRSFQVFRRHPVTDIQLTASKVTPEQGEQFSVSARFTPSFADNTSLARWSVSNPQCVQMVSNAPGRFVASAAGSCTITLSVGAVTRSITIQVQPTATGIKLNHSKLRIKVTDHSRVIQTTMLPVNAKGGVVTYSVSDPSVLSLDRNNGQITPHTDGTAVITAYLHDSSGKRIAQDSCSVEVLPKHMIINPDGLAVIAVVLLLLELVFMRVPASDLFMIGSIGIAITSIFNNRVSHNVIANVIIILLAIVLKTA